MKIFITGSSDGLGLIAAKDLIFMGHTVVFHARHSSRISQIQSLVPSAEQILFADLSSSSDTIRLAEDVNSLGPFDAIIHNAGVYNASSKQIFSVNCLAPYILTCLIKKPNRLIYLSSGMHTHGNINFKNIPDHISYSDSKLYIVLFSNAIARKWSDVYSNAVNPGWVPTKMGGRGAPDDLQQGVDTQVWLAVSDDIKAKVSGNYFFHKRITNYNKSAGDVILQEKFLEICEKFTGVDFPN